LIVGSVQYAYSFEARASCGLTVDSFIGRSQF